MKYALALFAFQVLFQAVAASLYYMDNYCGSTISLGYQSRTQLRLTSRSSYSSHMDCQVTISSGWAMMAFRFVTFSVEPCCDYLEIHDGGNRYGANLTGNGRISSFPYGVFNTVTNKMTLYFHSDGSGQSTGFEMVIGADRSDITTQALSTTGNTVTTDSSFTLVTGVSGPMQISGYVQVRLAHGRSFDSGRLEIYHNGQWGTVCDDGFGENEARVICRMLGYNSYNRPLVHGSSYYGSGSGRILLDQVSCPSGVSSITSCDANPWYVNDCSHSEDVGVDCRYQTYETTEVPDVPSTLNYIAVRLVNGSGPWNGRVEVYYQGQWGTVCDDSFDANDAYVICKMLGFARYRHPEVHDRAYYGTGIGRITVDDLVCSGLESSIANCRSRPWLSNNCQHSEDVGIDCYTPQSSQTSSAAQWTTWFHMTTMPYIAVRLANGYHPWQGRVEVYYQGQWGTVCDDGFGADDAYVICKMLGFARYRYPEVYTGAYYGTGRGRITVDNLDCSGYESSIENCRSNPWLSHDCSHSEDVGIDCYIPYSSQASSAAPWTTRTTRFHITKATSGTASPKVTWFYTSRKYVRLEDAISVNCNEYGWDITVDMIRMRSMYPNIQASDIYLGKNLCTGINYGSSVLFHQGLRECLTSETISGSQLIYRNELVYAIHDQNNPFIIRRYNWTVEVECDIGRNQTASGHLHHDFSTGTSHHVSGISSNYSVKLSFFQDPNFITPLQGNPINVKVGTKVYVKVYTAASDWDIKMVVHDCYTKPTAGSPDNTKYAIIRNGCEIDSNTHIISQSTHETRFVFEDFEYTSNHEGIHLFCDATFCSSSDYSSHCQQRCHSFG